MVGLEGSEVLRQQRMPVGIGFHSVIREDGGGRKSKGRLAGHLVRQVEVIDLNGQRNLRMELRCRKRNAAGVAAGGDLAWHMDPQPERLVAASRQIQRGDQRW
jgi:hypothetical protein